MQRRLGLGDLDLGGGHAAPLGALGEPAGEERLARAVLSTDRLEYGPTRRHAVEFGVDGMLEPLHADGEQVKACLRHGSPPERVDDLVAAGRADRHRSRSYPPRNCSLSKGMFSSTV